MIRPRGRAFAIPLSLLLLMTAGASARAQTLPVRADAHITDDIRDAVVNPFNFGAMSYLLVQSDSARVYKTYLKFDLSSILQGGTIGVRSATLSLSFSRYRDPASPEVKEANTIAVYGITDNTDAWNEGLQLGAAEAAALSWGNAPHNDKTSSSNLTGAAIKDVSPVRFLGNITIARETAPGTECRVDVTPFVQWALRGGVFGAAPAGDADRMITFVLVHTAGNAGVANNGIHFFSKENTAGPMRENVPGMAPRLTYEVETKPALTRGTVSTVVDAQTLVVRGLGNVRLAGVQALRDPRRKPQPDDDLYGDEADRACRRLAAGQPVQLQIERGIPTAAGVTAAWVFLSDGSLLNEQLIGRGYATIGDLPRNSLHYYRLKEAEAQAKAEKRGIWAKLLAPSPPVKPPATPAAKPPKPPAVAPSPRR